MAILFDDPVYSPRALKQAAEGLRKLGREADAENTLKERRQRYPDAPP
ncbi:MAG: hypothetical protein U1E27_11690 [Kiritimatiellia bacterium]|nr:hypothetical protein [Kiritimatiellia bacterium]